MFQAIRNHIFKNRLARWTKMLESVLEHEARVLDGRWDTDPNHALYTLHLSTAVVDCTIYIDTEFFMNNVFIVQGCTLLRGEDDNEPVKLVWRTLRNPTKEELTKQIEDSYGFYSKLFKDYVVNTKDETPFFGWRI